MTRDEIMNMPAGREMDALIAEKVMSEKVHRRSDGTPHYLTWTAYSTDMGAAWEVVDQMLFQSNQSIYLRFKYALDSLTGGAIQPSWKMCAYICRAALLAVMEL